MPDPPVTLLMVAGQPAPRPSIEDAMAVLRARPELARSVGGVQGPSSAAVAGVLAGLSREGCAFTSTVELDLEVLRRANGCSLVPVDLALVRGMRQAWQRAGGLEVAVRGVRLRRPA